MNLSVIIPSYNEEEVIADTIRTVQKNGSDFLHEIIVVDGGSSDQTMAEADSAGAAVITSPQKGRAAQMNYGASRSQGEVLYFLHADSIPPPGFDRKVCQANKDGYKAGCFRLAFDTDHLLLNFYAWCTRFNIDAFRFGDQSLFVERNTFFDIDGFREDHIVMEDNEIVRRIKNSHPHSFTIIEDAVETSARAYREVGIIKMQFIFLLIFTLYFLGVEQETLADLKRKTSYYQL